MDYQEPRFFQVMSYAASADGDVIDMVSGNPDWNPPTDLVAGLRDYADRSGAEFQYPPSDGLVELRQEIADRRQVDIERVVVTNGAGEANYLAMAAAMERDRGREIVLADPVYPYYAGKTNMLGGKPIFVETDVDGQLDPADVEAAVSEETACIVINSPNNPTGAVYPEKTVRAIAEIADSVDALLVSDEVYDHFDYSGRFFSALALDDGNRIVTNSFSKSMAITGFRVGYGIFPPELVAAARARHMLVNVAGSRPAQYAVLRALRGTDPEYYRQNRARLRDRISAFTETLESIGAAYTVPDGAFYIMAKFPGTPGTMDTVRSLIDEAGVAGMPGDAFGAARRDWLRFALVTPRIVEAGDRLAAYFRA